MLTQLWTGVPIFLLLLCNGDAYSVTPTNKHQHQQKIQPTHDNLNQNRRQLLANLVGMTSSVLIASPSFAFDGSGSSAYAGRSPATKAELKRQYKERIVADVRDFNALGKAINKGETEGSAWVNFFIQFQRREPDAVGRTYAGLVDLRGIRIKKEEFEGGDGMLLANTFTKAGKPPDNTPAVKSFKKLSTSFDGIEAAGKNGDAKKALAEWGKTKSLFETFLADVEMPSSLADPIYN
mmetsp:Transcript_11537/g.27775  ORF Transcript_11537/g.27775 Transcript_11537/m.27775 type:complete len:237 (-) Transcript_11537:196-906(-)|eukprot:CAMPEP_0113626070 /NCGR_PEP_ID=MMETSP0017_2-20120614/13476_1 /TAXON_ID=2856 /ORGANISM="Cylindrotheca closterium" /LENGTH=236 /DNA_ID=CAMNT_0000536225 /DNA_START=89 /DNA_END=799 /DNA_ORIENTATION=- /assembly_acc=CAM_ASM_000147